MPTYEYVCEKCGHQFELFQSMNDQPLAVCPENLCARKRWGKGPVKRQVGRGGGLIFKGSGFYSTDYRSDKYNEAAKNDKPPTPAKTTESTTESKPATSTPSTEKAPAKSAKAKKD